MPYIIFERYFPKGRDIQLTKKAVNHSKYNQIASIDFCTKRIIHQLIRTNKHNLLIQKANKMSSAPSNSKGKNKDKKSQQMIQLQHKVQSLMRQNLQLQITIKKLSDRATEMKSYQISHSNQHKEQSQKAQLSIDKLQTFNKAKDQHIQRLSQKKDQIQIENGCLNYQIDSLKKQLNECKYVAKQEYDDLKRHTQGQIKKYQQVVNEYQTAINERVEYLTINHSLQHELKFTKQQQKRQIADKDRDQLQTIDFMKKQMNQKAKQLKQNLLSMRRDQMATNTRLTVLQNQQLIQQLQYQSKHTQKVLKNNIELEKKVQVLSKQLQVEKEIIEELAKRSTIAKKIIKTLNDKNTTLQKTVQQLTKTQNSNKKSPQKQPHLSTQSTIKSLSKTINHLQKQLTQYEQKLNKIFQEKTHFQHLYEQNHPKYQYYLKHQSDLRLLMIRFLSAALEGQVVGQQDAVEYDISRLRNTHVDDWTKSDIQITVKMLLTFLKPHFLMKNMKTDFVKHQKWQLSPQDSIDNLVQKQIHKQLYPQVPNKNRPKRLSYKVKSFSSSNLNTNFNHTFSKGNSSTNVSPQKQTKDFSLYSALQDFKHKSLSRKQKNLSHHNLSQIKPTSVQQVRYKHTNDMKQNILQKPQFKPEHFRKDKQTSKLIRTNIREWGKKVQVNSKGAYLLKQK